MISHAQILARTSGHADVHVPAQFNVRITPHNSLPADRFLLVIAAIISVAVALSVAIVAAGAWPGAIFAAFDTVFLVVALITVQARMQRHEDVTLDGALIKIERSDRGTCTLRKSFVCYGLKIIRHEDPEFGFRALHLSDGRSGLEIARDLSPGERDGFCEALVAALKEAGFAPRIERRKLGLHPLE